MTDIKSMNLTEMAAYFKELGEPVFRAKQVFQWLHRGVFSFDEMTNLSKPLREKLAASCILYAPQVERRQVSSLDGTIKYLWRLTSSISPRQANWGLSGCSAAQASTTS